MAHTIGIVITIILIIALAVFVSYTSIMMTIAWRRYRQYRRDFLTRLDSE